MIVAAGDKSGKAATAKLRAVVSAETERVNEEIQARERDEAVAVEQKIADLRAAMDEALTAEKGQLKEHAQGLKDELRKLRDELESIKPMLTVGETELRMLDEKFNQAGKGRLFTSGMGAEAVRDIISRMDLETLARQLHIEVRTSSGQRRKKAIKRLRPHRGVPPLRHAAGVDDPVGPAGHSAGPAADGPARRRPLRHLRPE